MPHFSLRHRLTQATTSDTRHLAHLTYNIRASIVLCDRPIFHYGLSIAAVPPAKLFPTIRRLKRENVLHGERLHLVAHLDFFLAVAFDVLLAGRTIRYVVRPFVRNRGLQNEALMSPSRIGSAHAGVVCMTAFHASSRLAQSLPSCSRAPFVALEPFSST